MILYHRVAISLFLAAVSACSLTTRADEERAEQLALDPIFERLSENWDKKGGIHIRPAALLPLQGTTEVWQRFEVGEVSEP